MVVACVNSAQVNELGEALMLADEVWEKPYNEKLTSLRFRKLLKQAQYRWNNRVYPVSYTHLDVYKRQVLTQN